jgi:hypothetical protein
MQIRGDILSTLNCENGVSKIGLDVKVFILFKCSFFPDSSLDEEFRHNVYIYPILAAYSISINNQFFEGISFCSDMVGEIRN